MTRPTMLQAIQDNVQLSSELRKAPKARRTKKVKDSAIGLAIMAIALPIWAFTGYLATRPTPNLWVLAGGGVLGTAILVFGAIGADKETFGPVLKTIIGSVVRVRKS